MVKAALLLLILGGLALFALQNLTPFSLVVLGLQTQAFPLAFWMIGAIAAGALTTLVIAALFKVSNAFAAPRVRRSGAKRPTANRSNSTSGSWNSTWQPQGPPPSSGDATYSYTQPTAKASSDDWETGSRLEEWEDWEGYQEPVVNEPVDSFPRHQAVDPEPEEEWEDWDDYEDSDDPADAPRSASSEPPRTRTDFEVKQEPKTRFQSGSVYSYSYRDSNSSGVGKSESVYDADYRVITPPYQPEAEEAGDMEEDDWEFEAEDGDDLGDRPALKQR